MRSLRFLAIATSCAAIVISRALADPGDSKLKLWVQTPLSSPASLGMFLDLAANDPRVTPILRAETRRFVLVGTNPDQFVQDPDPIVPAGQIAAGVQALIEHFRAAPLSAPANNVLNGHGVAIMLSGFGFGGRDNEQHPTTNLGAVGGWPCLGVPLPCGSSAECHSDSGLAVGEACDQEGSWLGEDVEV